MLAPTAASIGAATLAFAATARSIGAAMSSARSRSTFRSRSETTSLSGSGVMASAASSWGVIPPVVVAFAAVVSSIMWVPFRLRAPRWGDVDHYLTAGRLKVAPSPSNRMSREGVGGASGAFHPNDRVDDAHHWVVSARRRLDGRLAGAHDPPAPPESGAGGRRGFSAQNSRSEER